jgi:hypothetical protein
VVVHRRYLPWLLAVLLVRTTAGCTVIDAPETIEELVVFGFVHYEDDPEYLWEMGDHLFPLLDGEIEGLETGYHVDNLDNSHLDAAGIEDPDTVSIIGALGTATYSHPFEEVLCAITLENKEEVFDQYLSYDIVQADDLGCFLDGDCEFYTERIEQTTEVPVLGEATQSLTRSFRWVLPDDGERYIVSRTLSPTAVEFNSEILEVDQQYALVIIAADAYGDGLRRFETFWVESRFLGDEVPEYFAVDSAVGAMQSQAAAVDEFLDGGGEGCL